MRQIPRKHGQRHRFFDADGVVELLSCVLRLTAEISAVKERLYLAERVLQNRAWISATPLKAMNPMTGNRPNSLPAGSA